MQTVMRRRVRMAGIGVSFAALALAGTACAGMKGTAAGSGGGTAPVVVVGDVSASPNDSTKTDADRTQQADAFTTCMRQNGEPDFPGVTITTDGQVHLNLSSKIDPFSDTYKKAVNACKSLLPADTTLPANPAPAAPPAPSLGVHCTGAYCPNAPKPQAPAKPS